MDRNYLVEGKRGYKRHWIMVITQTVPLRPLWRLEKNKSPAVA